MTRLAGDPPDRRWDAAGDADPLTRGKPSPCRPTSTRSTTCCGSTTGTGWSSSSPRTLHWRVRTGYDAV